MISSRLILKQEEIGPMMNFIYLIGCSETREAAVVDPAWDVPEILRIAEASNLRIKRILLTHGHPDHMNGLEALLEVTDAIVYLHRDEREYMRMAAEHYGIRTDFMNVRSGNFKCIDDDQEILVGRIPVRFLHTPGHTPGSQCFLVEGNLISGDTLFIDACGRVDLPGGDPEKMWWSLNHRLRALEDDIVLYPGHNYSDRPTSTMGDQKQGNPYMQFESVEGFLRAMGGDF
jgi:hydroxyacylglutathione hydrolase